MADVRGAYAGKRVGAAPEYRAYLVEVARVVRLSPHFVRITFSGAELAAFGYAGNDQRVKVLLPQPGCALADLPMGRGCHLRWRELPDTVRPIMRTYTARAFRADEGELDVDFVLHGLRGGQAGPLSTWAAMAQPGDEAAILGPDRPGAGRRWGVEWSPPPSASRLIIAGDETAVPAIGAIIESLPTLMDVAVCAEVPEDADVPAWNIPHRVEVRWLVRRQPGQVLERGVLLAAAVHDALSVLCGPSQAVTSPADTNTPGEGPVLWDVPDQVTAGNNRLYLWMTGEAEVMKWLRKIGRHDFGLPLSAVACMGYWRRGSDEPS